MSRPPPYIEGRGRHIDYNMKGNPVYEHNIVRGGIVQPPTHAGMEAYGLEERPRTEEQRRLLASLRERQQIERALASGGAPGSGMNASAQLTLKISTLVIKIQENMHFIQALDIEILQNIQGNIAILRGIYDSGLAYDSITNFFEQRLDYYITAFNGLGFAVNARKLFVELLNQLFLELATVYIQEKEAETAASVYAETVHPHISAQLGQPLPPTPVISEADWRKWQQSEAQYLVNAGAVKNKSFESYSKWKTNGKGGRRSKSRKNKNKNKRHSKSRHKRSRR
jgi:hypothetical protein